MWIFFVLLTVISLCQGFTLNDIKEPEQRIVGGYETDIRKHGYQISLRQKSLFYPEDPYTHVCGGSIYSENIIITAAHCVIATVPSELKVVAGSNFISGSDGLLVPVKEIVMHENYNPDTNNNDIAILVLATSLPLNKFNIRSIQLIDNFPTGGTETTIVGWGALSEDGDFPNTLQEVKIPVVGNEDCNKDYEGNITEYMLCAGLRNQGGKDACQGDSGGPLIIRNKLAGVVSWGNGCASPNFPGVFANVWTLKSWLLEKISQYE